MIEKTVVADPFRLTRAEMRIMLGRLARQIRKQHIGSHPDELADALDRTNLRVRDRDDLAAWRNALGIADVSEDPRALIAWPWDQALHELPDGISQMHDTEALAEFQETAPAGHCVGMLSTFQEMPDGTYLAASSRLPVLIEHLGTDPREVRITRAGRGELWARVTTRVAAGALWCPHQGLAQDESTVIDAPEFYGTRAVIIERGQRYPMDDIDLTLHVVPGMRRPTLLSWTDSITPIDGEHRAQDPSTTEQTGE